MPSGAWGWSPKWVVDNFWLVIPPLPGLETCGGPGRVSVGNVQARRMEGSGSGDLK